MGASTRAWHSAMRWLSPNCCVSRNERDGSRARRRAIRVDTAICVRGPRWPMAWRPASSRSTTRKRHSPTPKSGCGRPAADSQSSTEPAKTGEALLIALQTREMSTVLLACYIENRRQYDDRRRLAGNPLPDIRTANERVLEQYTEFEGRTLAVRGERLALGWTRWSNAAGFETAYLVLHEVGDDGRIGYQARFDEDDFEGAYRELTRRYCAGEGAAFAEGARSRGRVADRRQPEVISTGRSVNSPTPTFASRTGRAPSSPIARPPTFAAASRT